MGNFILSGLWRKRNRGNKGEIEIPPMPPYKKYVALLSQSGTDAPVATVLENTIGDIVWSYDNVGSYIATLLDAFPPEKTYIFVSHSATGLLAYGAFGNTISLITADYTDNQQNNFLNNVTIEIRVYN